MVDYVCKAAFNESLVVKLSGPNAGFTATGTPSDITDRIGVVACKWLVCTWFPCDLHRFARRFCDRGFDPEGLPKGDTNGNGASSGNPGSWRGILLDQFSHDRHT